MKFGIKSFKQRFNRLRIEKGLNDPLFRYYDDDSTLILSTTRNNSILSPLTPFLNTSKTDEDDDCDVLQAKIQNTEEELHSREEEQSSEEQKQHIHANPLFIQDTKYEYCRPSKKSFSDQESCAMEGFSVVRHDSSRLLRDRVSITPYNNQEDLEEKLPGLIMVSSMEFSGLNNSVDTTVSCCTSHDDTSTVSASIDFFLSVNKKDRNVKELPKTDCDCNDSCHSTYSI